MISRILLTLFAFCLMAGNATAQTTFPPEGWEEQPSQLASEFAEPGGKLSMYASQYPKSFNYQIENNVFSREIFQLMFETLLGTDPVTLENIAGLANKWTVSEDKKEFTFTLNPKAKWSDGKPITTEDVVWSFEAAKNPKHLTGSLQTILKRLVKIEAVDKQTVKITASMVHWKNLQACSAFKVLPKHWWKDQDFNKVNFEFPVVSGPYALGKVNEPHFARMEKRKDYWNKDSIPLEGELNFDTIEYRFYTQRDIAYEAFKKGEFDQFAVYTSSRWVKETDGNRFKKNWIVKQSVYNSSPVGFQGFAMNMRKAPYDDKRVRRALSHLVNRNRMNETIMFNQYVMSKSYWPDLWSKDKPCPNKMIDFDVEKARGLLKEAGWAVNGKTGKLEKDGKPFVIKFLTRDPSTTKFLLIYEEALNDVGIDLVIDQKDWSAWAKDMDVFNFDMTLAPWGAIPFKDAETMWHSSTADIKSSNNITGFKNEKVDKMIDQSAEIFDVEKRHDLIRDIDAIVYEETPYCLLWHIDYVRLLYWNKFGVPDHVLGKYTKEWASVNYWWNDELQAEDLEAARENKEEMPAPPREVRFENMFAPSTVQVDITAPLQ